METKLADSSNKKRASEREDAHGTGKSSFHFVARAALFDLAITREAATHAKTKRTSQLA